MNWFPLFLQREGVPAQLPVIVSESEGKGNALVLEIVSGAEVARDLLTGDVQGEFSTFSLSLFHKSKELQA